MWSRPGCIKDPIQPTERLLPTRGSDHHAFVDMLFLWGDPNQDDQNFRAVVLPHGFSLTKVSDGQWDVRDVSDFTRASVSVPGGKLIPSIVPLKRFSYNSHAVDRFFIGTVTDWSAIVYRTQRLSTQTEAIAAAKKWLDDHKPKWDSYISAVNFERRP